MENIHALLDKMNRTARAAAPLSVLEIDLLMEHTRQLYDALLSLRDGQQLSPAVQVNDNEDLYIPAPAIVEPATNAVPEEPAADIPAAVAEAQPEPVAEQEEAANDVATAAAATTVPEPETQAPPMAEEGPKMNLHIEMPAAETPAETYSKKLTSFAVSNRDIRMYIGINDQYNFISELFGNNNEAYEEILDEINTFELKEDALFFLANSGITTLYGWDDEHFSVRIFHNVLNQFFAAR